MRVVGLIIVLVVWLILQNMWLESTTVEKAPEVKTEEYKPLNTLPLR